VLKNLVLSLIIPYCQERRERLRMTVVSG